MKKSMLIFAFAGMLFTSAFAQVTTTDRGTATKTTDSKKSTTTSTTPASSTATKGEQNNSKKDAVKQDSEATAKEWTDKLDEVLSLDDKQYGQIMEINRRYAKQVDELKMGSKDTEHTDAEKSKLEAQKNNLTDKRMSEYKKVLNADQQKKLESKRNQVKDKDKASKEDKKAKKESMTTEEQDAAKAKRAEKKDKKEK